MAFISARRTSCGASSSQWESFLTLVKLSSGQSSFDLAFSALRLVTEDLT
jgi:hypothetical protein